MKQPMNRFAIQLDLNSVLWMLGVAFLVALYLDHLSQFRLLPPHPYVIQSQAIQYQLQQQKKRSPNRLFIYYIDALRFDYATNPSYMPFLNSLLPKGVWGKVKPCLTNMTAHCLDATFSGIDRSTLLSFMQNFQPDQIKSSKGWFPQLAAQGYKINSVTDYGIATQYTDFLNEYYVYKKQYNQSDLVDRAIRYFENPEVSVSIVHLMGPHDIAIGEKSIRKGYIQQLKEVDGLLKAVVKSLKPTDTLLVYGDHGISELGRSQGYHQLLTTFYLYKGPEIERGLRYDISIFSHRFFLNVLFRLPFHLTYQGEFYWRAFQKKVGAIYGDYSLLKLQRSHQELQISLSKTQALLLLVLLFLGLLSGVLFFGPHPKRSFYLTLPTFLFIGVLFYIHAYWQAAVCLLGLGIYLIEIRSSWKTLLILCGCILLLLVKAYFYPAIEQVRFAWWGWYLGYLGVFAVALFFSWHFVRDKVSLFEQICLGAAVLAIVLLIGYYPTLYRCGGIRGIPFALILFLGGFAIFFLKSRRRSPRNRLAWITLIALAIGFIGSQIPVRLMSFAIEYFYVFPRHEQSLISLIFSVGMFLLLSLIFLSPLYREWSYGLLIMGPLTLLGGGICFRMIRVPNILFALYLGVFLLLLLLPRRLFKTHALTAIRFVLAELVMAYAYDFNVSVLFQINGFIATTLLFYWLSLEVPFRKRWILGIPFTLLFMMLFLVIFGFRTNGINFRFVFNWLSTSSEQAEQWWVLIGVALIFKYALPFIILFLLMPQRVLFQVQCGLKILLGTIIAYIPFLIFLFLLVRPNSPLLIDSTEHYIFLIVLFILTYLAVGWKKRTGGWA